MKKNNSFKKAIVLVLMLCLLFTVTACDSKKEETSNEDDIEAFIEAEDGYNYSIHNAVDRYGSICLEITKDYPDEDDISFIHYIDKNCAFYYRSDDDYDVLYNSKVYKNIYIMMKRYMVYQQITKMIQK